MAIILPSSKSVGKDEGSFSGRDLALPLSLARRSTLRSLARRNTRTMRAVRATDEERLRIDRVLTTEPMRKPESASKGIVEVRSITKKPLR